jgi:hypothetical protein
MFLSSTHSMQGGMTRRYYLRFAGGIPSIGDADWYPRSKESRAFTGFTKVSNFGNPLTQAHLSLVCLLRERVQRPELNTAQRGSWHTNINLHGPLSFIIGSLCFGGCIRIQSTAARMSCPQFPGGWSVWK